MLICNLSFISEIIESEADIRLIEYVNGNQLLPIRKSAYRSCHSIETAIVSDYNITIGILNMGHVGTLKLKYMLAAFDTADHNILVDVQGRCFDIHSANLQWIS
jgi:hypothetical protein